MQKIDVLIILDACRYDIFEKVYKKIIGGTVEKRISPARHTLEYYQKAYPNKYNMILVSTNALLNSKGIIFNIGGNTYNAKEHFKKVIDVWDTGWDSKLNTVHPVEVDKHVVMAMSLYPKSRFIIHYMQPHAPYIYYNEKGYKTTAHVRTPGKESLTTNFLYKHLKQETMWKLADNLPKNGMGYLWKKVGRKGIIRGYYEDLKLVLKYVKSLMEYAPKKNFVITSDHGERLGEHGNYGHHHTGGYDKEIVEVPWWTNE